MMASTRAAAHLRTAVATLGGPRLGAARWLLALYLAAYLAASGPLLGQLWLRGEHLTPAHWSQHALLERLGLASHHGSVALAGGSAPSLVWATPVLAPADDLAGLAFTTLPVAVGPLFGPIALPALAGRIDGVEQPLPGAWPVRPPDPPPRPTS